MQIIIWFDPVNNPVRPWRYWIYYELDQIEGECISMRDCWRICEEMFVKELGIQ